MTTNATTLLPLALALVTVAMAVILRNSLPFAWTVRTTVPYLRVRIQAWLPRRNTTTAHANGSLAATVAAAPSAQGCDPFDDTWTWRHRATLDDCDLLTARMSNSAYPKNLDVARADFAVHRLADFVRDGGWMALASTSFTFHRPIALLQRYAIVSRIETWDDKWLYMRNEYRGKLGGDEATQVLYCTSITKHCFKYGRKTIAPWFVLAYCGYTGAGEATLKATNAARSRELRQSLQGRRAGDNPLRAFERTSDPTLRKVATWCTPAAWDVQGWEKQRKERMSGL